MTPAELALIGADLHHLGRGQPKKGSRENGKTTEPQPRPCLEVAGAMAPRLPSEQALGKSPVFLAASQFAAFAGHAIDGPFSRAPGVVGPVIAKRGV
jgi:hypothetical protein